MGIKDYYFLLGLPRFAPLEDVRSAYRKLASQYHPDKVVSESPEAQQEANRKMLELNEAMAILSDAARREQYHQLLDLIPERPLPSARPANAPTSAPGASVSTPDLAQPVTPPPAAAAPTPTTVSDPVRVPEPREEPKEKNDLIAEQEVRSLRHSIYGLPVKWKEKKLRGWQWALETGDMRRVILFLHRHFENLSRLSIPGVVRSIQEQADSYRATLVPHAVIAFISYGRLMDARDVQAQLRDLCTRQGWFKNVYPIVVLHDARTKNGTVFGSPPHYPDIPLVVDSLARAGKTAV